MTYQVINGRLVPFYLGWPVMVTPKLPTTTGSQIGAVMMLFGDLTMAAVLSARREVTVDGSTQRYADTDMVAYRGSERIDIVINDIGDTQSVGPMAALVGTV
jgi:HK97 family phage major capsid protein